MRGACFPQLPWPLKDIAFTLDLPLSSKRRGTCAPVPLVITAQQLTGSQYPLDREGSQLQNVACTATQNSFLPMQTHPSWPREPESPLKCSRKTPPVLSSSQGRIAWCSPGMACLDPSPHTTGFTRVSLTTEPKHSSCLLQGGSWGA